MVMIDYHDFLCLLPSFKVLSNRIGISMYIYVYLYVYVDYSVFGYTIPHTSEDLGDASSVRGKYIT
jgi:hypothetical protein